MSSMEEVVNETAKENVELKQKLNEYKQSYEIYFGLYMEQKDKIKALEEEIASLKKKCIEDKVVENKGNNKALDIIYKLVNVIYEKDKWEDE